MNTWNLNFFVVFIASATNLGLLSIVIFNQLDRIKQAVTFSFVASNLLFIAWFIINYKADMTSSAKQSLFWIRLSITPSLLGIFCFLWFSSIFPLKQEKLKRRLRFYLFATILLSYLSLFSSLAFIKVTLKPAVGVIDVEKGHLYPIILIFFLILIAEIFYNLGKNYQLVSKKQQLQIKYLIFGWAIFLIGVTAVGLIVPFLFKNTTVIDDFAPLFSIPMVSLTGYAIIKHELLDVKLVIQRSAIYSLLLVLLVIVYLLLLVGINSLIFNNAKATDLVSGMIVTCAGVLSIPHLEKYLRKHTDRWFYKNNYNYAEALETISRSLNNNLDLESLMYGIVGNIKNIFRIGHLALAVQETAVGYKNDIYQTLECGELTAFALRHLRQGLTAMVVEDAGKLDFKVLVRIATKERVTGFLALGQKLSGEKYSGKDLNFLATFSNQAAVAIEKAMLYEKLKQHAVELEEKVKERTVELKNLQQAQKQIMIDISHSLQTPLTIIKSGINDIKRHDSEGTLKTLEKTTDEISKRLYDLLRLARLESKEETFNFQTLNLSFLLRQVTEYVGVLCSQPHITLKEDIEPNIIVYGDPARLEEMINNLISNSIKYISNERIIEVSAKQRGDKAEITIKDSGIGMSERDLKQIFDRFYRAVNLTNSTGIGVGLAISKTIAEKHGGSISAASVIGKGSAFTIFLPLHPTS